ncbi:MAG: calcium/sodium antiporter [Prochloraceae cyanobacterium]|nr:calcium/sodium antiporter [Prochloraceae cyanobacterium]
MPELVGSSLIFIVSLFILIKAADYFTLAAQEIGIFFGIKPFIIGVTVVAIGTSLPELVSSVIATLKDSSEIVIGNVIGSNIANICLILGVASIMSARAMVVEYDLLSVDLPLFAGAAFFLAFTIKDLQFTSGEAFLCLLGLLVYILYTVNSSQADIEANKAEKEQQEKLSKKSINWQFIILVVSAVLIFISANFTIDSIIEISESLGIGKEIIAVSAVAVGTSLPELIVTIKAARLGQPEMAVGNILGSNIFNSFAVMGIPGLARGLVIPESILTDGIPVMLSVTILFFFTTQNNKVTKWEGWLFIIIYLWFIGKTLELF